ncbi:MiaB/RimO family radical SAM methylthiotransferase [Patescibacteria group bacterium]
MNYYLLTIGCQMNYADSERVAAVLEMMKYRRTENENEADIIGVVACAVRQKAMDRIYGKMQKWNKEKKKRPLTTFLTGCVLEHDRKQLGVHFDHFFEVKNLRTLPDLLGRTTEIKEALPTESYLEINPHHSRQYKAYIPIMNGCNAFCAYCAVPYTRGRETSRSPQEIIKEVFHLLENGYKEILLLGQIINKYFVSIDDSFDKYFQKLKSTYKLPNLPEMKTNLYLKKRQIHFGTLIAIINSLPFDFWLRYMSPHPKWFTDELIDTIARSEKMPRHLHIPVQSGDDEVLKKMLRPYTVQQFKDIVIKMRKAIPGLAVTTDIIVGFCGETQKQFDNTKKLFEEMKFDMAYISQYSPRLGAKAAEWKDDISHEEKERREYELNEILKVTARENNKKLVGKTMRVLVDNYNEKKGENTGKTDTFKTIKFLGKNLTGEFANIKVTHIDSWGLTGKIS